LTASADASAATAAAAAAAAACNCRNWLREGWYSFTVEGAIWSPNSQYDNLMSVAGIDKFGNKHAEYLTVMPGGNVTDSISLYGGFKGAGWVLPELNKTRVGVQRRPTWLNYFQGPETSITVSDCDDVYLHCYCNVLQHAD
jgi:hypothetical protein